MRIEIKGLDELSAKLRKLAEGDYLLKVLRASKQRLMRRLAKYPPPSAANWPQPAPGRWYQRGYGMRSAGGRGRRTSERLNRAWVASTATTQSSLRANAKHSPQFVIRNSASYAPFVMGAKRQTALHRRRGWGRVDEIVAQEGKVVEKDLVRSVVEILQG